VHYLIRLRQGRLPDEPARRSHDGPIARQQRSAQGRSRKGGRRPALKDPSPRLTDTVFGIGTAIHIGGDQLCWIVSCMAESVILGEPEW
jgi:hypothetical protein